MKHLYRFAPNFNNSESKNCSFCNKPYSMSELFENYGFSKDTCRSCLREKDINLLLSNNYLQPIWRSNRL